MPARPARTPASRARLGLLALLTLVTPLASSTCVVGCGSADANADDAPGPEAPATTAAPSPSTDAPGPVATPAATPPDGLALHFVFVNGLLDPAHYATGDSALRNLEKSVLAEVAKQGPAYQAAHHVKLTADSVRINVYTALDGTVPSPGTDDGSGDQVAQNWRSQLSKKLGAAFPHGEKNIILIGHSTGGRVAMEIAADVGGSKNVLGAGKWGWQDRIAGVVTVHGMLDALNNYPSVAEIVSFETGCKVAKKSGWCEYAAQVSSWPAADWVAQNRHSLVLTGSYDDCGFPIWAEESDNALPLRAQGSPASVGIGLAKTSSGSYSAAHGTYYGHFCHSDITGGSTRSAQAVASATTEISKWLFSSAPRVVNANSASQTFTSPPLAGGTSSLLTTLPSSCPTGASSMGELEVVGNCSHPGLNDGDDHPMTAAQLSFGSNGCGGTVQWTNTHADAHAGSVWFKSYAVESTAGLVSMLPTTSGS